MLFAPAIAHAVCPDGYTTYRGTVQDGVARNSSGICAPLCEYGGTKLATSTGLNISLFADKTTFPAVHVELNGGICYADLAEGRATGALNVSFNDKIYHTMANTAPCPETYTLSFDCGDGAIGAPPEPIKIAYGDLYTAPYGGCIKPGYSLSGWKIDSTSLTKGEYKRYAYTTDKTMVAQWSANAYAGAVTVCSDYCANKQTASTYVNANYGAGFTTPAAYECPNRTFTEWGVYDAMGNDTGETLAAGESTTWTWADNIQLRPQFTDEINYYTLSFDCGDGAIGVSPEPIKIAYGDLYTAPYGGCIKPGYSLSGWKIDSTSLTKGEYRSYTYTTDKTMVARWSANAYAAAYICDNGSTNSSYISATYGNTYTPSTTVCTAPSGTTFGGYAVHDAFGNDTGDVIASGASFTWNYPYNIQLHAIWVETE